MIDAAVDHTLIVGVAKKYQKYFNSLHRRI